jgi:hypothetical protein
LRTNDTVIVADTVDEIRTRIRHWGHKYLGEDAFESVRTRLITWRQPTTAIAPPRRDQLTGSLMLLQLD